MSTVLFACVHAVPAGILVALDAENRARVQHHMVFGGNHWTHATSRANGR